jgi:hypothetical protein
MAYRTLLGVCVSTVILAACSSDETAPAFAPTDDGGSTGGSTMGTGGRSTRTASRP